MTENEEIVEIDMGIQETMNLYKLIRMGRQITRNNRELNFYDQSLEHFTNAIMGCFTKNRNTFSIRLTPIDGVIILSCSNYFLARLSIPSREKQTREAISQLCRELRKKITLEQWEEARDQFHMLALLREAGIY